MRWLGQLNLTDVRRLSEGGHGEVYAAKLVSADGISQEVVLKLARAKNTGDLAMSRRFLLQEARLTATFNHPNIIAFRDYNLVEVDGEKVPCLIMEHGGVPLSAVIQSHGGRLEPGLAAFVAVEVLAGLAYSHSREVIHRDVKPQNVLVGPHGQVRLIDYGIAKAADPRNPSTVVTNLKGTPVYISPEAYKGEKLDGRADLWSVGVMLFEMVIGRKPWEDDRNEPNEMVRLRRLSDLVMAGPLPHFPSEVVPDDLAEVITKMLMKNRDDRYEDALQAMYALERVARRLVGPWAAARELGQQALAASDPVARRRQPTLEESTANVRTEVRNESDDVYVSVVVRPSDSVASMVVPPEMLEEDEELSEVVALAGRSSTGGANNSEITLQMALPPSRRAGWKVLKPAVVAASLALAAAAAVLGSGGQRTAARGRDEMSPRPTPVARRAVAETRPLGMVRDEAAQLLRPMANAGDVAPVKDGKGEGRGSDAPVSIFGRAATDASSSPEPEGSSQGRESRKAGNGSAKEATAQGERAGVGELEVVLIPRGSFVSLDGQPPVRAPVTFHKVRQGSHQLRVGLTEQLLDRSEKVRVKAGEAARVELELANPFGD